MSHRKNACGKRDGRAWATAGFFAPLLIAAIGWLASPGEGLAQVSGSDPLSVLQQRERIRASTLGHPIVRLCYQAGHGEHKRKEKSGYGNAMIAALAVRLFRL